MPVSIGVEVEADNYAEAERRVRAAASELRERRAKMQRVRELAAEALQIPTARESSEQVHLLRDALMKIEAASL